MIDTSNVKDLFSFTRSERRGILVLVVLLILSVMLRLYMPLMFQDEVIISNAAIARMDSLQRAIVTVEEKKQAQQQEFSYYHQNNEAESGRSGRRKALTPFTFDPNTLEKTGWKKLGFTAGEVSMIMNFRDAGAVFYKKQDVQQLYCVSEEDYGVLEPYIKIKTRDDPNENNGKEKEGKAGDNMVVDLNLADTADLLVVPGIGPYTARMILKYREMLGGYICPDQLAEVYGAEDRYQNFLPFVEAEPGKQKKINLNEADYHKLLKHPYINKRIAYQITEYRRLNGEYASLEELKELEIMPDSLYHKLCFYLQID
ncbi:MAG: helix-hairpin-helix domain-containing protein [Bacteroidales bacterium]